jgi:hypothetical protein
MLRVNQRNGRCSAPFFVRRAPFDSAQGKKALRLHRSRHRRSLRCKRSTKTLRFHRSAGVPAGELDLRIRRRKTPPRRRRYEYSGGKPASGSQAAALHRGRRKLRGEWAASRQEPLPGSAATPLRMTLDERPRRMGGQRDKSSCAARLASRRKSGGPSAALRASRTPQGAEEAARPTGGWAASNVAAYSMLCPCEELRRGREPKKFVISSARFGSRKNGDPAYPKPLSVEAIKLILSLRRRNE